MRRGLEKNLLFCSLQLSKRNTGKETFKPMAHSNTILRQLFTPELRNTFAAIVRKHEGDKGIRTLSCWNQLLAMLFAQLTGRQSLRETASGFNAGCKNLYHLGAKQVSYSTLAHANKTRPWVMYQELALELYNMCCKSRPVQKRFRFKSKLFIMDASVIALCLSLFPWAKYRTRKGAVKMHTLLDWSGSLPAFMVITDGKVHDSHAAWNLPLEPGSIIVFDRGYLDYALLYHHHRKGCFFVTRLKKNSKWRRVASRKADRKNGVICDQDIRIIGTSAHKYPETLRRIRFRADDGNVYEFLTNRFDLVATTIADIYKARWDVELFFKWIKQNLKIKSYLGTSQNAVFSQIWIAMCAYLMLSYHKFLSGSCLALSRILSLIQLYIFAIRPLDDMLHEKWKYPPNIIVANCQLTLEGF